MTIKNWIKSLPLWAKSGIIAVFIGLFIDLFFYAKCYLCPMNTGCPSYCNIVNKLIVSLYYPFDASLTSVFFDHWLKILSPLLTLAIYFVVGSIIGLIIKKLKTK